MTALCACDRLFLPKPPETVDGSYLVHIVSGSESREDIETVVLWYTGSEDNVPAVRDANPGVDLGALKPGQRVMIPSSLVTQTNAMPRRKFTLGMDVPPQPAASDTPEATERGARGDPLEELMRKQERRLTPRPTPSQVDAVPGLAPPPSAPPVNLVPETSKAQAQATTSKAHGSPKLESFSEDEIGALSSAPADATFPQGDNGSASPRANAAAQTKNPRSRRAPQPEVFDEE